jgi:hypothetical protein
MEFLDNNPAEDGSSMAISYGCPNCGRSISMITNPGETQMVRSLDVTIGHESLGTPAGPMALIRDSLAGQQSATATAGIEPVWTEKAMKRLAAAPTFVQGMVHRLYTDYARQKGYTEITPAIMSEARDALGMTEM